MHVGAVTFRCICIDIHRHRPRWPGIRKQIAAWHTQTTSNKYRMQSAHSRNDIEWFRARECVTSKWMFLIIVAVVQLKVNEWTRSAQSHATVTHSLTHAHRGIPFSWQSIIWFYWSALFAADARPRHRSPLKCVSFICFSLLCVFRFQII